MRLTVLGSGASFPMADRGAPGFLLECSGARVLVDCGPGSLRQLARLGMDAGGVSDIFLTHAHIDHTADLWPFLFLARSRRRPRTLPLRLHGSEELLSFTRRVAAAIGPWAEPRGYLLVEVEHHGEQVAVGEARARGFPVPHLPSSLAFRFEEAGRTVVFSGDTGEGSEVAEAAQGADLLVLECSTADGDEVGGHLTPSMCVSVLQAARPRRVLIHHFFPGLDPAAAADRIRSGWGGEVQVAEDLASIEV